MKKIILLVTTLLSFVSTHAQTLTGDYLDINNVKAGICSIGYVHDFETPKGSGRNTIFAGNLWIGGIDAGGALKIAGQTYCQTGTDYFPGPLTSSATTDATTMAAFNRVWKLNKCDIDTYVNWFYSGSTIGTNPTDSTAMEAINTWPAFSPSGSPLAPFVDANGNGIYDPYAGDYPLIKGDQAIFFVFNDKGGVHGETGGASIGLEIQGMAYAYSCSNDSALYNTIFTNYKIINKSSFVLDSTYIGNWTDTDIGNAGDDFVGCDVTRGAYYGYNGDSIDGSFSGMPGYGANPPAQGIVFLTGPYADPNGIDDPASTTPNGTGYGDGIVDNERLGMSKFIYYNNDATVTGNPSAANHYYNYLAGDWKDNTSWTYGGTGYASGAQCDYMYPGITDPLGYGTNMIPQSNWSEETAGDIPGDRRGMGSYGPFTFQPGAVEDITFAYVFGRATSGGNLASVVVMQNRIDSVRQKVNNGITNCGCATSSTGINNLTIDNSISIYPNPASENITIKYTSSSKNISLKIYDMTGRMVKQIINAKSVENIISISEFENGLYLINVIDGKTSVIKRFVKE